jgi:hypothetical protein
MSHEIGPALPPHLQAKLAHSTSTDDSQQHPHDEHDESIGPALPPHLLKRKQDQAAKRKLDDNDDNNNDNNSTGSGGSGGTDHAKRRRVMGPSLDLLVAETTDSGRQLADDDNNNTDNADDDDDDVIGPLPPSAADTASPPPMSDDDIASAKAARDREWAKVLGNSCDTSQPDQSRDTREEWMLSLPKTGFISMRLRVNVDAHVDV